MLLIEFNKNFNGIIHYRNVDDDKWNKLNIDIEILNLLISNFGIISTIIIQPPCINIDNPSTGTEICMKYCGADISLHCGCNVPFNFSNLEQRY